MCFDSFSFNKIDETNLLQEVHWFYSHLTGGHAIVLVQEVQELKKLQVGFGVVARWVRRDVAYVWSVGFLAVFLWQIGETLVEFGGFTSTVLLLLEMILGEPRLRFFVIVWWW